MKCVEHGAEIRMFDPRRNPGDWVDLMQSADCAVLLSSRTDSSALGCDGRPFADPALATCVIFQHLEAAERFFDSTVRALPHVRCEIYDEHGLAKPPLAVVMHPDFHAGDESGPLWTRRRRLIAGGLAVISAALFWGAAAFENPRDVLIFLGINGLVLALRFLYWDAALQHRERQRQARLEAHRSTLSKCRTPSPRALSHF
jgi:hypothetical protein